jgi:hypothetical protein
MSKLDGNERWNSKMLLTEHQEQYESRNSPTKSSRPTVEEMTMIRECILLPHMLTMVQRDMDKIKQNGGILKRINVTSAQAIMDMISKDMRELKRKLSQANIKIHNDEQVDMTIFYHYTCRGYQERFGILREVMRAEISVRLGRYQAELARAIKSGTNS